MEKHAENKKDTQPLSSASAKKTRRGKEYAASGCSNEFCNSEVTATGIHFFKFPSLPSDINHWCNQVKRQNYKDGFNVFSNVVLCHHHFMETDLMETHF